MDRGKGVSACKAATWPVKSVQPASASSSAQPGPVSREKLAGRAAASPPTPPAPLWGPARTLPGWQQLLSPSRQRVLEDSEGGRGKTRWCSSQGQMQAWMCAVCRVRWSVRESWAGRSEWGRNRTYLVPAQLPTLLRTDPPSLPEPTCLGRPFSASVASFTATHTTGPFYFPPETLFPLLSAPTRASHTAATTSAQKGEWTGPCHCRGGQFQGTWACASGFLCLQRPRAVAEGESGQKALGCSSAVSEPESLRRAGPSRTWPRDSHTPTGTLDPVQTVPGSQAEAAGPWDREPLIKNTRPGHGSCFGANVAKPTSGPWGGPQPRPFAAGLVTCVRSSSLARLPQGPLGLSTGRCLSSCGFRSGRESPAEGFLLEEPQRPAGCSRFCWREVCLPRL